VPRKFRVVKTNDPAAVFDDLEALRQELPAVATKRARAVETFARFPHERALALRDRISSSGWVILIELDRLILKGRGRNPVRLTNHRLRELGIRRDTKQYQLRRLEMAGVIKVVAQERRWTVVTHLWFPVEQ
jgi:DNA-binding transcriptional ArsR family regulator